MIVNHLDNNAAVISMDTFYAKVLCEYLKACISHSSSPETSKLAASFLAQDGWSTPPEQIETGMQTLQSVLSRFTDQISKKNEIGFEEATKTIQ